MPINRIKQFAKSFKHAMRGLRYAFHHEKNFQNEIGIALIVIVAMIYFKVTRNEAIVLMLVIFGVLVTELLNTMIERMVDILKPRVHPYAKLIKDLVAASVLLSSILAAAIGLIIFLPYISQWFDSSSR